MGLILKIRLPDSDIECERMKLESETWTKVAKELARFSKRFEEKGMGCCYKYTAEGGEKAILDEAALPSALAALKPNDKGKRILTVKCVLERQPEAAPPTCAGASFSLDLPNSQPMPIELLAGLTWREHCAVLKQVLAELNLEDSNGVWFWFRQGQRWLTEASLVQFRQRELKDETLQLREPPQLRLTVLCRLPPVLDFRGDLCGLPHELRPMLEELKRKLKEKLRVHWGIEHVAWREDLAVECLAQAGAASLNLQPELPEESKNAGLPVEGVLGSGGFATVFAVRVGGEVIAAKIAHTDKPSDKTSRAAAMRHECKVLWDLQKKLAHDSILQIQRCIIVSGTPGYLMPLAYSSLATLLEKHEWWPWRDSAAQELFGYHLKHSVLDALFKLQQATSGSKWLHLDIKAENILVTYPPGKAARLGLVLADWGCATLEGEGLLSTTVDNLPPEEQCNWWQGDPVTASQEIEWHMLAKLAEQLTEWMPAGWAALHPVAPFWLQSLRWRKKSWQVDRLLSNFSSIGVVRTVLEPEQMGDSERVLEALQRDPMAWAQVDLTKTGITQEQLLSLLSLAVERNPAVFYYAAQLHEDVAGHKSLVERALPGGHLALKFAHEDLKKDKDFVLKAVGQAGGALQFAQEDLKKDKEIVLEAVRQDGRALEFVHEDLKKDKEIVLEAVRQEGFALQYAHEDLKKDKEIVLEAVRQDGGALQFAQEDPKKDKEIVLEAVRQDGFALQFAQEDPKKDKEIVLEAVRQEVFALNFAHEDLKKDQEIVLEAVRQDGRALKFAHEDLKKDKDFVLKAVRQARGALQYAQEDLKKDKEIVLEAVRQDGFALQFAHEDLKKDKDFVLKAVGQARGALQFAQEDLKKDKEIVLEAVRQDGRALEFVHEDLKKDKEIVLEAVRQDGRALEFVHEDLKKDKEIVLEAVRQEGFALHFAQEDLKKDKEIVLEAIRQDGFALNFAQEDLKKDKEIVLEAVRQDGRALEFAHEDLKKDKEIVLEAVRQEGFALEFAHEDLKKDKGFVFKAVGQAGGALQFAQEDLKKDKDFVLEAVRQDGFALQYAHEDLKKDQEIVLEAVRQDGRALQFAQEDLKKDKEIVLEAVRQDGFALHFAQEDLKKDKEIVLEAVRQDGGALQFAQEDLKKDKEIVLEAVRQDGRALEFAQDDLKEDKDFVYRKRFGRMRRPSSLLMKTARRTKLTRHSVCKRVVTRVPVP